MPSSPQWADAQKRASSNGGFSGLMKSRWPKGQPGYRWKSLAHVSTEKKGTRSAWPQKDNWHWNNWDAIPDPQRAHEETVGSLDPESEANLQLTYGRAYPQWTPQQKFGGVNGDTYMPYSKYKKQLNVPHPKKSYGFKYLKAKYYRKDYKDLVRGSAIDNLDNGGWGVVDHRIPIKTAVDEQAPQWLRKLRSNGGEPIGDALHNFWQGGSLVDASPGGGGRSDTLGYKEGKAGELMEDHNGWLQNVPKGHLNPFLGRRDEPEDEKTYNQDEFDPGESFMQKAKETLQLATERNKLLSEGRHVQQQLKLLNSKMAHTKNYAQDFQSSSRGAVKPAAPAGSASAFAKANVAFARAMALEAHIAGGAGVGAKRRVLST